MTTPTRDIDALIQKWTSEEFDEATRKELKALIDAGNRTELEDRFRCDLEFGTGGLRGVRGAGTNRMNNYTVGWAAQGLANYVKAHASRPGPLRAAISYDCRHGSREFAEVVAGVFAANGIIAHVFKELRPTPELSFAIRRLGAHTGVMLTASHNPKEYGGFKAYWDDGSQVVPPHDKGIVQEVLKVMAGGKVSRMSFDQAVAQGLVQMLGTDMDRMYLDAIRPLRLHPEYVDGPGKTLSIVYTPLHGCGSTIAPAAFQDWGFSNVHFVKEQMINDGDFPTAKSPNPEEGEALELGIALAREKKADIVLATDPDADRLGIAVRHDGDYQLITGNQLCALLADYIFHERRATGKLPPKPGMVSTIVTSNLVPTIAQSYGAACPLVLTGFKWIADEARAWERGERGGHTFLYGTEESYGYLIGDHCRDKDGIVASLVTAEMAAWHKSNGRTLVDAVHLLWARHGVHLDWGKSVFHTGAAGAVRIQNILKTLKNDPPKTIGEFKVEKITRVDLGEIFDGATGKSIGRIDLPKSDVLIFDCDRGARCVCRPSGTEPKIKFYFFLRETAAPAGEKADRAELQRRLADLARVKDQFQKAFLSRVGEA